MAPFHLLRLPRELRDTIYKFYLTTDGGYVCDTDAFINGQLKGANNERIHLDLVFTCRQVAAETERGGLGLILNAITFSTISNDSLSLLAVKFHRYNHSIDRTRLAMLYAAGHCVPDAVYSELKTAYPRLMPLLDRMKTEGKQPLLQLETSTLHRRGPYGEAPSVFREFTKDTLQKSVISSRAFKDAVQDLRPFEVAASSRQDERRWNPFDIICSTIAPWNIPSDTQFSRMITDLPDYETNLYVPYLDPSIYRFSAAAAAIFFLQCVPHNTLKYLRRITLDQKQESVANPECHARGLIPFCQSYPLLRVERRASLWGNVFQEDINYLTPEHRCEWDARHTPAFLNSDQITGNIASWVIEAEALIPAGMPAGSFSLILDGDPAPRHCANIFQSIVQRDIAWQLAWIESTERGLLRSISWFERRGDDVMRNGMFWDLDVERLRQWELKKAGFWGYFFEDFPQAMDNIASKTSVVKCNFDVGETWDVGSIVERHRKLLWGKNHWQREWFKHSPQWWETEPPLPEWANLLGESVREYTPSSLGLH